MNKLSMPITTTDKVKPYLEHINSLLTNAILKYKAAIDHAEKSTFSKKPDHQWKFKKLTGLLVRQILRRHHLAQG